MNSPAFTGYTSRVARRSRPLSISRKLVYWSDLPQWFLTAVAISFGLLFGSFLNVVIHRLPRGQSVVHPPSTCPGCGARIRPWHNVPVVSWLLLRGRAACCGVSISARYPLVELIGGLCAWAVLEHVAQNLGSHASLALGALLFFTYLALCLALIAALFIDVEYLLLPDSLTLGGAALGLLSVAWREITLQEAAIGAAFGFVLVWLPFDVVYRWLRGQPGMGLGDAKLLLLAGAWFGWVAPLFCLLAGAVQGSVFALTLLLVKGKIEEPVAVKKEREDFQKQLAELTPEERTALEREFGDDVLLRGPGPGIGQARLAFGPFLILALFEYLFFQSWLYENLFVAFLV